MTEVVLRRGVPVLVTPIKVSVAQNPMEGWNPDADTCPEPRDTKCCSGNVERNVVGDLYVSEHGDIHKEWLIVLPGNYVRFDKPLYFLHKSPKLVRLPVYSML